MKKIIMLAATFVSLLAPSLFSAETDNEKAKFPNLDVLLVLQQMNEDEREKRRLASEQIWNQSCDIHKIEILSSPPSFGEYPAGNDIIYVRSELSTLLGVREEIYYWLKKDNTGKIMASGWISRMPDFNWNSTGFLKSYQDDYLGNSENKS